MIAPALILALIVARVVVMSGRQVEWSAEMILACFGQDALVAVAFLGVEAVACRWRRGGRVLTTVMWLVVAYVALNVAVARVLPTPLTWPMLRAAGAPIADSIRLYATWSSLLAIASVLVAAGVGLRAGRRVPVAWARSLAVVLIFIGVAGAWTGPRVETWGLQRNALVTLVFSALPAVEARASVGEWRQSFDARSTAEDLTALSGIAAGRHVVVIGLESVGAQYLKTYGAAEDVMPRLGELAEHGVVFDQAYAVSPDSIRSLYSVLCARYPAFDTPIEAYATGPCASLATALRNKGYETALFHSGRFGYLGMTGVVRDRGFDTLEDAGHIGGNHESSFGVDEPATVARILSWIDSRAPEGRFALAYMPIAGHHPYVFPGAGAFGAATDLDRYRSALHDGDAAIGVLIDGLKSRGLFEQTMFVVYGDHGQAFGQHPGNVGHTFYLYEENVRVPLLIAVPGAIGALVGSGMTTSLIDVTPTAFDLLGLARDTAHQGQSSLTGPPRTALMFTDYGANLVALRDGRWKCILDLGAGQSRLFDLDTDPGERDDLAGAHPTRVAACTRTLREWSAAQKARHRRP